MTIEKIRKDLKNIRTYYADREVLDAAFRILPHRVKGLVDFYAKMISEVPLELYKVYYELYVRGLTQEAAAEELNYCTEYVRMKNKELLMYFQSKMEDE